MRRFSIVALACLLLLPLVGPGPVAAEPAAGRWRTSYIEIAGRDVPGTPKALDRVGIVRHRFGTKKVRPPRTVLVLVPGFFGGAGSFGYTGQRLVERDHSLQVWAVERRSNLLENRCGMELGEDGGTQTSVQGSALYYLGGYKVGSCTIESDDPDPAAWNGLSREYFPSQQEADSVGMEAWGLSTALEDVRAVIRKAHRDFPEASVVLGGHSLGGMTTQAYAAWRFGEKKSTAGWQTVDGLVLIDGSLDGTHWEDLIAQHFDRETELAEGLRYWQRPEAGYLLGYLAEVGGMAASFAPENESFIWSSLEGTPLQWPVEGTCPTNKAIFAGLTDDSYAFSPTFEYHQGELTWPVDLDDDGIDDTCGGIATDRALAHWSDFDETGELTSTDRWARATWEGKGPNFAEWFFPIALNSEMDLAHNLDSKAVYTDAEGKETTARASHGHRLFDGGRVKLPVYGFVTANCLDRYEWYEGVSSALTDFTLIDRSAEHCSAPAAEPWAHLDPLYAEDEGGYTNDFFETLVDWLGEV